MKWIALTVLMLLIAIAALWLIIGGPALGIALGAFFGILCFVLGSWWSAYLLQNGAQIALTAQESDDRRDERQMGALAQLMREGVKTGRDYAKVEQPQYPALPFGGDNGTIDARFTIAGFDDE